MKKFLTVLLAGCLVFSLTACKEKKEASVTEENPWFIGVCGLVPADVIRWYEEKKQITYSGYGILVIDESCEEEKLFATVKKINVKGKVFCSDAVKRHYGLK